MYASRGAVEHWLELLSDAYRLQQLNAKVISRISADLTRHLDCPTRTGAIADSPYVRPVNQRRELRISSELCEQLLGIFDAVAAVASDPELKAEAQELALAIHVGQLLDPQ